MAHGFMLKTTTNQMGRRSAGDASTKAKIAHNNVHQTSHKLLIHTVQKRGSEREEYISLSTPTAITKHY